MYFRSHFVLQVHGGLHSPFVTCSNKTRNKSHGAILRYKALKFQREKNNLKVKYEGLVFLFFWIAIFAIENIFVLICE